MHVTTSKITTIFNVPVVVCVHDFILFCSGLIITIVMSCPGHQIIKLIIFCLSPSLRLLLNAVACITRWDGGSSLASKSAAPIFPLPPVNFFFLLNFTKKSELY